ncbi:MAG: macrocin O-methyltransferase [Clostridiales bacterium]|nr:macrocin O-methyltransferase [Clostridiales bacterium]MDY5349144.1 TylF/MycF/NovP-related O-methyltransferase [Candidatus Ventricola sp.]
METVVILGAGQMGKAARNLLNLNRMELVAIGDNNPKVWDYDAEIQILPVAEALQANPDRVIIGVLDDERTGQLIHQARSLGYQGRIMALGDVYSTFDLRAATFRRLADRVSANGIEGALAELGTYRGDFAWQLNERFPERRLYLFDTFDGFDERDIRVEREVSSSRAAAHDFSDTRARDVLARMPYEDQVVIRKGFFPETAQGLEERFALVSIDVDLYAPTLAGLEYFYPRLVRGGAILLHDYNSLQFDGVRKAVEEYERRHGMLPLIPLSDLHGTAVITRC